jgi:hypothetical protein
LKHTDNQEELQRDSKAYGPLFNNKWGVESTCVAIDDNGQEIPPQISTPNDSTTGQQLKEKGINYVSEHNENWMERCLRIAPKYLRLRTDFTGEDIRFLCVNISGDPKHHNAFGALVNTLIKRKIIVPTGEHRQMKDRTSHSRSTPVYKAAI